MKTLRKKAVPVNRVLWGIISIKYRRIFDVSIDSGLSKELISKYIHGKIPSLNNQYTLSKLLGIPAHILFNEKDIEKRLRLKEIGKLKRLSNMTEDNLNKFKVPEKWNIQRPVFFAILLAEDVTITDLANICKISSRSVQNYIYKRVTPHRQTLDEIVDFLDFNEEYLLYEKEITYSFGAKLSNNYNKKSRDTTELRKYIKK